MRKDKKRKIAFERQRKKENPEGGIDMKKKNFDAEKVFQIIKMKKFAEKVKIENTLRLAKYGMPRF